MRNGGWQRPSRSMQYDFMRWNTICTCQKGRSDIRCIFVLKNSKWRQVELEWHNNNNNNNTINKSLVGGDIHGICIPVTSLYTHKQQNKCFEIIGIDLEHKNQV